MAGNLSLCWCSERGRNGVYSWEINLKNCNMKENNSLKDVLTIVGIFKVISQCAFKGWWYPPHNGTWTRTHTPANNNWWLPPSMQEVWQLLRLAEKRSEQCLLASRERLKAHGPLHTWVIWLRPFLNFILMSRNVNIEGLQLPHSHDGQEALFWFFLCPAP